MTGVENNKKKVTLHLYDISAPLSPEDKAVILQQLRERDDDDSLMWTDIEIKQHPNPPLEFDPQPVDHVVDEYQQYWDDEALSDVDTPRTIH